MTHTHISSTPKRPHTRVNGACWRTKDHEGTAVALLKRASCPFYTAFSPAPDGRVVVRMLFSYPDWERVPASSSVPADSGNFYQKVHLPVFLARLAASRTARELFSCTDPTVPRDVDRDAVGRATRLQHAKARKGALLGSLRQPAPMRPT
jgi:hypothetical protein